MTVVYVPGKFVSKKFKIIPIAEIKLGMVVHAIAEQVGSLSVKSKGKVSQLKIIDQLRANGVKSVVVDNFDAPKTDVPNKDAPVVKKKEEFSELSIEFRQAKKVLKQGEKVFNSFAEKVRKDIELDLSPSKKVISGIYRQMQENPNALLCMSMINDAPEYQSKHALHSAAIACHFGNYLRLSKRDCERLSLVAFLLDIGMLKIDRSILTKATQLSYQESLEIQKHVQYSLELVAPLKLDRESMLAIEQHHERLDGSGYPNAYTGSKIHKFSRIISIIDCYDALTSVRTHKIPLSPAAAMKVLNNPDYGYDQKLVLRFIKCMGIFPVGSMVALSNKQLGLVSKVSTNAPSAPTVKVFYDIETKRPIKPMVIDLQGKQNSIRVLKPVLASQYNINIEKYLT